MGMSPLSRKVALMEKGITMADIGRGLVPPVTSQQVSQVNAEKRESSRVQDAIAEAIGRPIGEVFGSRAEKPSTKSSRIVARA